MSILTSKRHNFLRKGLCILIAWIFLAMPMMPVRASDEIVYYHNDDLGSPVAATDEQGNLLWQEDYKPYGERILKQDNGKNSLWYTGKPEEKDFGINYFGARWYDPSIGRFMAMDPVPFQEKNIHSFNRYAYANNNPYKFVDPDGNQAVPKVVTSTLTWSDFTPLPKGQHNAYTIPDYILEPKQNPIKTSTAGDVIFDQVVINLSLKEGSYVVRGKETPALLGHEQGHMDLFGIAMRDAGKALLRIRGTKNKQQLRNKMNEILNKAKVTAEKWQKLYDDQTKHSTDPVMQKKWTDAIQSSLRNDKEFSPP